MDNSAIMNNIVYRLFKDINRDLGEQRYTLFMQCIGELGIEQKGSITISSPFFDVSYVMETPGRLQFEMAPNRFMGAFEELHDQQERTKHLERKIRGFLKRAFLRMAVPGDLPALLPKSIHNYFPAELEKEIYNSAQVLNRWAIDQFRNKEEKTLQLIKRQLLENIVLQK